MNEQEIKIDKWFQHEGLDRVHMILTMMQEGLGYVYPEANEQTTHPSIWNTRCEEALSKATEVLADLYQAIGEWEE